MNGKVARLRLHVEEDVRHKGEDEVGEMEGRNETSKCMDERSRCVDQAQVHLQWQLKTVQH